MSLPLRLRQATQALHTQAERSGVMRALLRGTLPLPAYVSLLQNLHAIYAVLEPALTRHATHPWVAAIHDVRLARTAALHADLAVLSSENEPASPGLATATAAYVDRLRVLEREDPSALIAHAYVRYLGDLSGGQLLGPRVARMFGLPEDGPGTAFYRFDDADALARRFRSALGELPPDPATQDRIVAEAGWAFSQHVHLFEQLQATMPDALAAS